MSDKPWNPLRLDVAAFARADAALQGEWPATELPRLADAGTVEAPASAWPVVRWQLSGEERKSLGAEAQTWLHLRIQAEASPTCQRCLRPVRLALDVDRAFRFVRDEALAAELDADSEDDVLVISRAFDVREWVEDELLLALPIVPLHEPACPEPLRLGDEVPLSEAELEPKPNPFAVLQALKKPGKTES